MANVRIYKHNPCGPLSRNNKIVAAAYLMGFTNIMVTKYPTNGTWHEKKGWYIQCDQRESTPLGYSIEIALNRLEKLNQKEDKQ